MMNMDRSVYADLVTEGRVLDDLVAGLGPAQWRLATPAPGWTVTHQIAHLASTAQLAAAAAGDPGLFRAQTAGAPRDFDDALQALLAPFLDSQPHELLIRWRAARNAGAEALSTLPPGLPLPWLSRPLPAGMLASAGIMELFAHGQDIADALGAERQYTDRIRHVVRFAVGNWDFGYQVRGLTPPPGGLRFDLIAPSGARWEFGHRDAAERVSGPAADFCLLATRRRHRDDLTLTASGPDADHWLDIAQAYRGSPGPGRAAGNFTRPSAA
jgi:uncharacterized protein (TIGR03084 family)